VEQYFGLYVGILFDMRHRKTNVTLDRKASARNALLKGLATQVIQYEHIVTTTARAKAVKPIVETLITRSKNNTLATRRYLMRHVTSALAVDKCLEVLGPRYRDRKGGYLRIIPLGPRKGDGADQSKIEFV